MKAVFIFLVVALTGPVTNAQIKYNKTIRSGEKHAFACNFFSKSTDYIPIVAENVSEKDEIDWINSVTKTIFEITGLQNKIIFVSAPGSKNCAAICFENTIGKDRFIIFDRPFLQQYEKITNKWFVTGVLAHELGHHLNGHTITGYGSRPDNELEADAFAGFVMQKLGATKEEAKAIFSFLEENMGPPTHPVRSERYLAIERGWNQAQQKVGYANLRFNDADNSQVATRLYFDAMGTENTEYRISLLKRAYDIYPANPSINSALGMAYLDKKDFGKANFYTALAIKQSEGIGPLWLNRAKYFIAIGNKQDAINCLDTAILLKGIQPEAYYLKASILEEVNDLEAALEHTTVATAMEPKKDLAVKIFLLRASLFKSMKNKEAARANYRIAKAINPDSKIVQLMDAVYEY